MLNADENELLKCCNDSVTTAQERIQTILKHSLAHLETNQTTLEQEAQKVVVATEATLQESLKELQREMADDASVQGIIAKIEELKAKVETFAQEMLARAAQNGMGAIDNVGSPAHLFAKIETFAQEMLARQAQSALGTPPQAG